MGRKRPMKQSLYTFLGILLLALLFTPTSYARTNAESNSAYFTENVVSIPRDLRAVRLQRFLEMHNSPLSQNANTFVEEADKNNIDWKLVAAISGVESTFGQQVPYNCNNAWGFGIYGDHRLCFISYDAAISTISQSLRQNYIDKWGAKDVYAIGHLYAASPTWAARVSMFMDQIDAFTLQNPTDTLSISL